MVLPAIKKKYVETGQVEFIFMDFPLNIHPEAMAAALAAGCAQEQGKFWEFHDLLFEDSASLDRENFPSYGQEVGLDGDAFAECREKKRPEAGIEQDLREGGFAGVGGTPSFFLGRRIQGKDKIEVLEALPGSQPHDALVERIEHWLGKI